MDPCCLHSVQASQQQHWPSAILPAESMKTPLQATHCSPVAKCTSACLTPYELSLCQVIGSCAAGKTLLARAVANRTDACFIRVIGSELVQKYVGEGARMVRDLFQMARTKKACVIFFDEVDAIGGARFDDGAGGSIQQPFLFIAHLK